MKLIKEAKESFFEFYALQEGKKAVSFVVLGLLVWLFGLALYLQKDANYSLSSLVDDVVGLSQTANAYMSLPVAIPVTPEDPLTAVSNITEELKLRDRMTQMSSNNTGVVVQFEKLYTEECLEIIRDLLRRGLNVKTAELKAVPHGDKRLLSASFVIDGAQKQ